jgi:hypothetical protein
MPIEPGPSSIAPPQSSTPIHHIKFQSSPSPIPLWAYGNTMVAAPVYSLASPRPMITPSLPGSTAGGHCGSAANGTLYGGIDGLLSQECSSLLPHVLAAATTWSPYHAHNHDAGMEARAYEDVDARLSPCFYKLEFATYYVSKDPLNWLNHYEQFFRGQHTPTSDRTWLASYHLKGLRRRGTTPWSTMRACLLGTASLNCVVSASDCQYEAHTSPSWDAFPSCLRSRNTRTASWRCYVERATSPLCRRRNCSWVAFPNISGWTSKCEHHKTCRQPCTWHVHLSATRQPCHHLSHAGRGHRNGLMLLDTLCQQRPYVTGRCCSRRRGQSPGAPIPPPHPSRTTGAAPARALLQLR